MLKPIIYKEVFYEINEDMGLAPNCHECTSHIARTPMGQVRCNRDGFRLLHKWVYWKETGKTPPVVKQLCENNLCINPAHMKGMTIEQALQTCLPPIPNKRPPVMWGNTHHRQIRDSETLNKIWELHDNGLTPMQIGQKLALDADIIRAIINRQAYRES